jgi:hypothetical protein
MASLKGQRAETERARGVQESAAKRRLAERRAMIEAKRRKALGDDKVDKLRESKREAEADRFLKELDRELVE